MLFFTACEKDQVIAEEIPEVNSELHSSSALSTDGSNPSDCNPFSDLRIVSSKWQQVHRGYYPMQFNSAGLQGSNDLEPRLEQYVPILQTQGSTAFMDAIQQASGINDNRREMLEDLLVRLATTASNPSAVEATVNGFISDYCVNTEIPQADKKAVYAIAESIGGTLSHEAQFYGESSLDLSSGADLSARSMPTPCWLDVVLFTAGGAILGGVFGVIIIPEPDPLDPSPEPVVVPSGPLGATVGAFIGLSYGLQYIANKDCSNDPGPDCGPITSLTLLPGYTCSGGVLSLSGGGADLTGFVWENAGFISPENATTLEPRLAVDISDINLAITSNITSTCVDGSSVNMTTPLGTSSLSALSSDIYMQFYSYNADANDFQASIGQEYDFYIASSRPSTASHTVTFTSNAPWVFSITQDPDHWYEAIGSATGHGTANITATVTDLCTGTSVSESILISVQ